jgi:hypothetical protein
MTETRVPAAWLRSLAGFVALAGVLALTACGGGSGSPSSVINPPPVVVPPLFVLPPSAIAYSNIPTVLTISGGLPPYRAFSSNAAVLPVPQDVSGSTIVLLPTGVSADSPVVVTIQDAASQSVTSAITVRPAPLFNSLTVIPSRTACGSNAVCAGDTALVTVLVLGPAGAPLPNRQVRFDVVTGSFGIQSNNPALPLVTTLTVVSDGNGSAKVTIRAAVNAPTQNAVIRATELTTCNQVTANCTIVQVTDGTGVLSTIPTGGSKTTINGPALNVCSAGVAVATYIFGGTPPYTVATNFPGSVALTGVPVLTSGGGFNTVTNGSCFTGLVYAITDATGLTIVNSPTVDNLPGTQAAPVATPLLVSPPSATATPCNNTTFNFVVSGGTPPYGITLSNATNWSVATSPVNTSPGSFAVTAAATNIATTVVVVDSGTPTLTFSAPITCN